MKVFVGCSSYDTIDKKYFDAALKVSNILISKNYDLIFGCSTKGLMGSVYNEWMNSGRKVTAVCTEYYKDDLDSVSCDKVLVPSTYEQLNYFMKNSNLFVFMPGGYGTINELFYIINEYVVESHKSKIIIINTDGFYDEIKSFIKKIEQEKFVKLFDFVKFIDTIEEFNDFMEGLC